MDNEQLLLASAATIVILMTALTANASKKKRRPRSQWCRPWLARRMEGKGILHMVNEELRTEDPSSYTNFLRLTSIQFDQLLELVAPSITKQDTVMRQSLSARSKLEVTLRFLATGETFRSLMYSTRIHESTISRFVPKVCLAIITCLKEDYLKMPQTPNEWKVVAKDFNNMWQFPHCLGSLDGRHITFRVPISAGAYYHNYKGTNSIVLLGLADAKYRFLYVNIGVNGRVSDGGVFQQSSLCKAMADHSINFPEAEPIVDEKIPYVIVADEAFPLSVHLLKPYSERALFHDRRVFNYRLSRARRVVENAFGILANRFRVLLTPINLCVEKTEIITLCCVLLHNYLATNNATTYINLEEEELQQLPRIGRQCGNRTSHLAREVREWFKTFFNSPEGALPWQEQSVAAHNY